MFSWFSYGRGPPLVGIGHPIHQLGLCSKVMYEGYTVSVQQITLVKEAKQHT